MSQETYKSCRLSGQCLGRGGRDRPRAYGRPLSQERRRGDWEKDPQDRGLGFTEPETDVLLCTKGGVSEYVGDGRRRGREVGTLNPRGDGDVPTPGFSGPPPVSDRFG